MLTSLYRSQLSERRRAQIMALVEQTKLLPSTLTVPMKVLELQHRESATMADFAAALSADPSLAAKLLAVANSAAFHPERPVAQLSLALAMIGLKNLMPLALGLSLGGIFNRLSLPSADRGMLWKAALLKATAAREHTLQHSPAIAEEAYLCGLLQDIALTLIYASDPSAWPETTAVLEMEDAEARRERERLLHGIDHAELGMVLVQRLGLPQVFQQAVATHHDGHEVLAAALDDEGLAAAVDFASQFPHRIVPPGTGFSQGLTQRLAALPGGIAAGLLPRIAANFSATLTAMGNADETSGIFKQFLMSLGSEVASCMETAMHESVSTIWDLKDRESGLTSKIAELQQQAIESEFDLLTTTLNRRGFLNRAQRMLAVAEENGLPCTAAFLDIDDLKHINDAAGHRAGDQVLSQVGKELCKITLRRGIVGRIGGDEFVALFIPDKDETQATAMRNASTAMATPPLPDGTVLKFTVSMGLLPLGVPQAGQSVENIIERADALMYQAKRAGKARCVTTP